MECSDRYVYAINFILYDLKIEAESFCTNKVIWKGSTQIWHL